MKITLLQSQYNRRNNYIINIIYYIFNQTYEIYRNFFLDAFMQLQSTIYIHGRKKWHRICRSTTFRKYCMASYESQKKDSLCLTPWLLFGISGDGQLSPVRIPDNI